MNDPNKVISVNLSALLSLKAELQRKKVEVTKAKNAEVPTEERSIKKSKSKDETTSKNKNEAPPKIEQKEDAKVYEVEDSALLEKSKRVLEAKAKFYDKMSRAGGKLNMDDNCLVQFNRKKQEDSDDETKLKRQYSSSDLSSSGEEHMDDEDDWVEFKDCLGRTRRCLRKDLETAKKRDAELAASMPERIDQSKANWMLDTNVSNNSNDGSDEIIGPLPPPSEKTDGFSQISKLDEQRIGWERKELENLEKIDVHYQDVFFDEARQHGVGYYAFSTDEEERKRQQDRLQKVRQKTLEEQKQREEFRSKREKIIAERVLAAKNRQRARLGLPPLDEIDEAEKIKNEEKLEETKEERRARKREEKQKRKNKRIEEQREFERQQHLRPWDRSKKYVANNKDDNEDEKSDNWTYKPERLPMSQKEWNEKKRTERNPDFAPPQAELKRTNFNSSSTSSMQYHMVPPPTLTQEVNFNNYQSSKRTKQFHRKNYQSETYEDIESSSSTSRGATIPPPADLDCTLPINPKKSRKDIELENSIEAGLRFLRNNCDKGTMSTKSSWTAKADY
ncbi:coiled-coil domain-containing protein 174 [Teleopsis dalmanni]|uniref:coiled-coil domain-containing protein 174 n=1 Tax=Teleopsis dalmanni TaxID=139649 RepID=UPI0018CEC0BB|nr:coiled-coil domain-containing protein 174 [Teleopsis dalmanni]